MLARLADDWLEPPVGAVVAVVLDSEVRAIIGPNLLVEPKPYVFVLSTAVAVAVKRLPARLVLSGKVIAAERLDPGEAVKAPRRFWPAPLSSVPPSAGS